MLALVHVLVDDEALDRRVKRQRGLGFPALLEGSDLFLGHVPEQEPAAGSLEQAPRRQGHLLERALSQRILGSQREQEFLLGRDEFRAVDLEKRLPGLDELASEVHVQFLDPARHSRMDMGDPRLVIVDPPDRPNAPHDVLLAHHRGSDADQLLALGRDHDRALGHVHGGVSRRGVHHVSGVLVGGVGRLGVHHVSGVLVGGVGRFSVHHVSGVLIARVAVLHGAGAEVQPAGPPCAGRECSHHHEGGGDTGQQVLHWSSPRIQTTSGEAPSDRPRCSSIRASARA